MGAAEKVGNVSCMDCSNPVCMSACRRSKLDSAVEIPKVIAQVVSIIENMPKEVAKCKVNYEVAWTRDTVYYDKTGHHRRGKADRQRAAAAQRHPDRRPEELHPGRRGSDDKPGYGAGKSR